jgi:hypothetical protein
VFAVGAGGSSIAVASGDGVCPNKLDEDLRVRSAGDEERRSVLMELEDLLRGLGDGRGDDTLRNSGGLGLLKGDEGGNGVREAIDSLLSESES